jgi:hypothetical protein
MATEILEPSSCDKTTSGWSACGSCSAGSETCDCTATSDCTSGTTEKSGARFYNFGSASYQSYWTAVVAKMDYKVWAHDGDDSTSCTNSRAKAQYSTNGGSTWSDIGSYINAGSSNKTGTVTKSGLSTSLNVSNFQMRIFAEAKSCSPCASSGRPDRCWYYDSELGKEFSFCASSCSGCTGEYTECEINGCT